jgi:three-Cys-motif partner protein
MAADLKHYRDREQSYIKHQFLTRYLQAAAYKTLQGHSNIFNFVDAFAGPWKVSDMAKYSDASFDQAINTLEAVRADLGRSGIGGLKIRFCLCEKNPQAVQKLHEYAKERKGFDIHIFGGEFESNLDAIAKTIPNGFTFTFIDPTGWNIRNREVFNFLKAVRGDFLVNFMSDHINRHAEYSKVVESFGHFLADPEWAGDFARLPSHLSNEEKVLHLFKSSIRSKGVANYTPDFSIMVPRIERRKMRLVLGTKNPKGLELFRDVQWNVEREEIKLRTTLREGEARQFSMFSPEMVAAMQQGSEGIGCRKYKDQSEKLLLEQVASGKAVRFDLATIDIMDQVPIRAKQMRDLAVDMKKRGVVAFELPVGKRVPQQDTLLSVPGN